MALFIVIKLLNEVPQVRFLRHFHMSAQQGMVSTKNLFKSKPRSSEPHLITSREQPATFKSFNA
mgnify:CR=1 FL=1